MRDIVYPGFIDRTELWLGRTESIMGMQCRIQNLEWSGMENVELKIEMSWFIASPRLLVQCDGVTCTLRIIELCEKYHPLERIYTIKHYFSIT